MFSSEQWYVIVMAVIVMVAPFLPSKLLFLLDSIFVRIAMVILLLFFISMGPTAGIFGLVMIGALYLERNRRKVTGALAKLDKMDAKKASRPATVAEASAPQQTVPVPSMDAPDESDVFRFVPESEMDITNFEPVAPSINQKAVLTSVYPTGSASHTAALYEELGVGHVKGVETIS